GVPFSQLTEGHTPVIASGSNRSPEQLARKYKDGPEGSVIVTKAKLYDFDSVYSAHFAGYGSIAATLQHTPGAVSELSITWLNAAQLERMHETESLGVHYDYGCLSNIRLEIDNGPALDKAFVYNSRQGCMSHNGNVVALSEITSQNRSIPSLPQADALRHARDEIEPEMPLEEFIQEIIDDPVIRMSRTEALYANAIAFGYAAFTKELPL
ncbi:MAG: hypothetical protein HOJ88_05970, partial [Proteobacteria bacterium]|nr:hypothetical protein [Pseudomonadota bacterium]